MPFRITALPITEFIPLFSLDDRELAARRACRIAATPGMPCRVSLLDATPGEPVILVNYLHQPAETPYRASHAIFVREAAVEATPTIDDIPEQLGARTLSLRAFDAAGTIVAAELVEGAAAVPTIEQLLANPAAAYIHAHFARYGCYAARIDRA